jgi:hypothetical protein
LQQAEANELERLLFVARDGFLLNEIASAIRTEWHVGCESEYFYGSRQAWHLAATKNIDASFLNWLFDRTERMTIRNVFARIDLAPEELSKELLIVGFGQDSFDKQLGEAELNKLISMFSSASDLHEVILKKAEEKRIAALGYFNSLHLGQYKSIGFVDVGWKGRLQDSFEKILLSGWSDASPTVVTGLYFGLNDRKDGRKERRYFYYKSEDSSTERIASCNTAILELMTAAPHGSTTGYSNVNNRWKPVFKNETNLQALDWGLNVQIESCTQAAKLICSNLRIEEAQTIDWPLLTEKILSAFVSNPTVKESKVYGKWKLTEDQTEDVWYPLAPEFTIKDALLYFFTGKRPHHNIWIEAAIKNSGRLAQFIISRRGKFPEKLLTSILYRSKKGFSQLINFDF